MDDPYEFHLRTAGDELDEQARGLLAATRFAFNLGASSEENDRRWWQTAGQDGQRFRYATRSPAAPGLGLAAVPVATFVNFTHTVNVGDGRLLDADFITDVTVRATDRRRGLLRRLMTEELTEARQRGLALATLTVSEGGIYGRFGFGVATTRQRVEVDTGPRFRLRHEPTATVEQADPAAIADLVDQLHADFHAANRGSHQRLGYHRPMLSGEWDWEAMAAATKLRAAVAVRDGRPVGAVTYELADEAEHAKVVDLVGDDDAELALWRYLADLDLVDSVRYGCLTDASPLRAALVDPRVVKATFAGDLTWLRLLDVPAALQARGWDGEGEVVLQVTEPLGLADGCWRLAVRGGSTTMVACEPQEAQVSCGVDVLAETYFGLAPLSVLAAAGRVAGQADAIRRLGRMLLVDRPPRNTVFF